MCLSNGGRSNWGDLASVVGCPATLPILWVCFPSVRHWLWSSSFCQVLRFIGLARAWYRFLPWGTNKCSLCEHNFDLQAMHVIQVPCLIKLALQNWVTFFFFFWMCNYSVVWFFFGKISLYLSTDLGGMSSPAVLCPGEGLLEPARRQYWTQENADVVFLHHTPRFLCLTT